MLFNKKINKSVVSLLLLAFATVLAMSGCTLVSVEDLDPNDLPLKIVVDETSPYFVTTSSPISFTGDIAADFGATRLFMTDTTGDTVAHNGGTPTNIHDINEVYVAYDSLYVYFGIDTVGDLYETPNTMNAILIHIANNITSGPGSNGLVDVDNGGIFAAGLSGDFGFDTTGLAITNGQKISFYLKHWRNRDGVQWPMYNFVMDSGPIGRSLSAKCSIYPPNSTYAKVTEVKIPWGLIFGEELKDLSAADGVTMSTSNISFVIISDPTLAVAGSRDVAPNDVDGDMFSIGVASEMTNFYFNK